MCIVVPPFCSVPAIVENGTITSNRSDYAEIRCFVRCSSFYEVNVYLPGRIRVISSAKSSWPLHMAFVL